MDDLHDRIVPLHELIYRYADEEGKRLLNMCGQRWRWRSNAWPTTRRADLASTRAGTTAARRALYGGAPKPGFNA
jgi:hypothetical protein